jgi:heterodisulfide reductase subunit C
MLGIRFTSRAEKVQRRLGRLNKDGWVYGGLPGLQWEVANARAADRAVIESVRADFVKHVSFPDYFHSCINCGNCTAVCPAFRIADFSPRVVVQKVMHSRGEPELLYQMVDQYIWACFQCYSCWDVCPAQNNPGGLIAILKESAVRHGLPSTQKTLEPYSRILYKIMTTGTQITPDMHTSKGLFRDWGPHKVELAEHLTEYRAAIPVETLAGVEDKSWQVDQRTMDELLIIEREAGVIDMVKSSNPDVGEIVGEEADQVELATRPVPEAQS